MPKNQLNKTGITLVETLIVLGIVATLMGVLWLIVGPRVLVSSRKAAISAGLKQASTGLAIYRADYDDAYPADWQDFGFAKSNTPENISKGSYAIVPGPPEYPKSWMTENGMGVTELTYLYNSGVQRLLSRYKPVYPFDEHLYPIFAANFFVRLEVEHGHLWSFVPPNYTRYSTPGKEYVRLACFTDGHVAWCPTEAIWEKELMYKSEFGE